MSQNQVWRVFLTRERCTMDHDANAPSSHGCLPFRGQVYPKMSSNGCRDRSYLKITDTQAWGWILLVCNSQKCSIINLLRVLAITYIKSIYNQRIFISDTSTSTFNHSTTVGTSQSQHLNSCWSMLITKVWKHSSTAILTKTRHQTCTRVS